jgi:co-chaperonin GroES (HSP10)
MEKKASYSPTKINKLLPLRDQVIVADMNFESRTTSSGIVLLSDNGKGTGVRPRWGRVYAVGPEQTNVKVGQWILVAHGRWTRGVSVEDAQGVHTIRKIDPNDMLLVSDEPIIDDSMSDAIHIDQKNR